MKGQEKKELRGKYFDTDVSILLCYLQVLDSRVLREGLNEKQQIIHILWISILPPLPYPHRPELIIFKLGNSFYPHLLTRPPSALIHIYRY